MVPATVPLQCLVVPEVSGGPVIPLVGVHSAMSSTCKDAKHLSCCSDWIDSLWSDSPIPMLQYTADMIPISSDFTKCIM